MKTISKIILIFSLIFTISTMFVGCSDLPKKMPQKEALDLSKYEITFLDDFNGTQLDTTKWRFFTGEKVDNPHPKHIHRGGYYSSDSDIVFLKDGNLHISTKYKNGQYGEGWYSAWIETSTGPKQRAFEPTPDNYEGFAQKEGYFEVRCIAPPAQGIWSAFWLMPNEGNALTKDDVQWTASDGCEVDVMESPLYFRSKSGLVQHVIHSDYGLGKGSRSDKSPLYKVKDMYTSFHTYGVLWENDMFTFYIDGYKTYSTKNVFEDKILGTPDVPECLLLSVEVAGHSKDGVLYPGLEKNGKKCWQGTVEKMPKDKSYDFIVDYVKVLKRI